MSSNRTNRKSARSIIDHHDSLPPTKKFNAMHISENGHVNNDQKEKKKRIPQFHRNSDASVLDLQDFKYMWRTKFEIDVNDKKDMTGCKCASIGCDRNICKCAVGNVHLVQREEGIRVKNPIRLSRHFYDSNYSECTSRCQCNGKCNLRFRTGSSKFQLVVKKCYQPEKGLGVFTESYIPAGSFVCELVGKFLTRKQWLNGGNSDYVFRFMLRNRWTTSMADVKQLYTCIDARNCGNESRYINSSCKPNLCLLQSRNHIADHNPTRILFIAVRNIAIGEELTYFYGRKWLKHMRDRNSKFVCKCGEVKCRLPKVGDKVDDYISFKNPRLFPSYEFSDQSDDEEGDSLETESDQTDSDIEIIECK